MVKDRHPAWINLLHGIYLYSINRIKSFFILLPDCLAKHFSIAFSVFEKVIDYKSPAQVQLIFFRMDFITVVVFSVLNNFYCLTITM